MHAILVPLGSSGDVHPYLGLGLALQQRGHRVEVLTNEHFGPLVRRLGLDFGQLGDEATYHATIENPDLWHPSKGFKVVTGTILKLLRPLYEEIAARYEPGETIVVGSILAFGARIANETLGVPMASAHLQPSVIRSAHLPPIFPGLAMQPWWPMGLKRGLYWLLDRAAIDPLLAPGLNEFRAELGLPPIRRVFDTWLHSPQLTIGLFPNWFAPPQPDWPRNTVLTGFPLFDERGGHVEPPGLSEFLAAGDPPIVFTPGSANLHGRGFFAESVEVCRRMNRRGLFLTRYTDQIPSNLPDTIRHVGYIPFSEVLPKAAALVHHGGVGTCAQALAAGIPQLVTPLGHDQFDNAARLRRLGVGGSVAPKAYRAPRVARVLSRLTGTREVAAHCREYAGRLRDADPLAETCAHLERLAQSSREPVSSA